MPSHFSLNLKTLSARQNAVVLSIGIVAFDNDKILEGTEIALTVEEQVARHRHVDTERLHKWLKQMKAHDYPDYPFPDMKYPPRDALRQLNAFILDHGSIPDKPNIPVNFVWCRGVNFDWAILENLSHEFEIGLPFQYNAIKDQRQFCDDHVEHMPEKRRNAEFDAIYHALNIQSALKITAQTLD